MGSATTLKSHFSPILFSGSNDPPSPKSLFNKGKLNFYQVSKNQEKTPVKSQPSSSSRWESINHGIIRLQSSSNPPPAVLKKQKPPANVQRLSGIWPLGPSCAYTLGLVFPLLESVSHTGRQHSCERIKPVSSLRLGFLQAKGLNASCLGEFQFQPLGL